jgi:hypothetical protein
VTIDKQPLFTFLSKIREETVKLPERFYLTPQQVETALLWAQIKQQLKEKKRSLPKKQRKFWEDPSKTAIAGIMSEILEPKATNRFSSKIKLVSALESIHSNSPWIRIIGELFSKHGVNWEEYRVLRHGEIVDLANDERLRRATHGQWTGRIPWGAFPVGEDRTLKWRPAREKVLKQYFALRSIGYPPAKAARRSGLRVARNVLAWLDKNPVYRAFAKGDKRGCTQYEKKIYRGLHHAIYDYETWEALQKWDKARARAHPIGLLWWTDDKTSQDHLIVDPGEKERLLSTCNLYRRFRSIVTVASKVGLRPITVRRVLDDEDYKVLGEPWKVANQTRRISRRI